MIKQSKFFNFQYCRIPLPTKFNFEFIENQLQDYHDKQVVELLKFGFPVDCQPTETDLGVPSNHKGATEFNEQVQALVNKEVSLGGVIGLFEAPPFENPCFSPLNSVPKKDSQERRLILDLSYPSGFSINDGIHKDIYLGEWAKLKLSSLDQFAEKVMELGAGCKMFKVDLSRGYKKIYIDPVDIEKMGFTLNSKFYFDCTLSMGSRSSARCCQ